MPDLAATVIRWPEEEPATEAAVHHLLDAQGLRYYRWSNGPGDLYGTHSHPYYKVIYIVRGSITFGLPDTGQEIYLEAGDRLDLPAGVQHNAVVGPQGVACLEAHS